MAQALDLAVCNHGPISTWERGDQSSYIDVTMTAARLRHSVTNWAVLDGISLSDHNYIEFQLRAVYPPSPPPAQHGLDEARGHGKIQRSNRLVQIRWLIQSRQRNVRVN